eukprot:56480_1
MESKQPKVRTDYAKMNSEFSDDIVIETNVMQPIEISEHPDTDDIIHSDQYIINFKSKLADPTARTCFNNEDGICSCCCNLLVGSHIWLIYLFISSSLDTWVFQRLLYTLNYNCSAVDLYVDQNSICLDKQTYITNGITIPMIYLCLITQSIEILISILAFIGIHKCIPRLILLQILYLVVLTGVDIYAGTKKIFTSSPFNPIEKFYWYYYIRMGLRMWPTHVFYRVYKWAVYYKNGGEDEEVSESDVEW